jgi:hypothetical protein
LLDHAAVTEPQPLEPIDRAGSVIYERTAQPAQA